MPPVTGAAHRAAETFVPAYPAWVWFLPLTRRPDLSMLYRRWSRTRSTSPARGRAAWARGARGGAWVAIGVNERNAAASRTTLYNTLLLFDDQGRWSSGGAS